MTWSLQPHNYTMAIRPNWYSIGYRRTGAYKGMGMLGQTDATTLNAQLWNLPLVGYSGEPAQVAMALNPITAPTTTSSVSDFFQQYGVYVALGVAVLLLLGGRRR